MDCPIRAESGKGRSAHIFNLNERAVLFGAKNREKPAESGGIRPVLGCGGRGSAELEGEGGGEVGEAGMAAGDVGQALAFVPGDGVGGALVGDNVDDDVGVVERAVDVGEDARHVLGDEGGLDVGLDGHGVCVAVAVFGAAGAHGVDEEVVGGVYGDEDVPGVLELFLGVLRVCLAHACGRLLLLRLRSGGEARAA